MNTAPVYAQFDDSHIRAVDASATTCGDGTTWSTAYQYLQDALAEAVVNDDIDEIWVKAGEYFDDQDCANPDGTGLRTATFTLVEGVKLYGGFDGTEIFADERDPVLNLTILNGTLTLADPTDPPRACTDPDPGAGDCFTETLGIVGCTGLSCCDLVCDIQPSCCIVEWDEFCVFEAEQLCTANVYHVVTAPGGTTLATIVDGFKITKGAAINGSFNQNWGGGLFMDGAAPSIVRCNIEGNVGVMGGGAFTRGAAPLLMNCTFIDNTAREHGGGLASWQGADPLFVNCLFSGNAADGDNTSIDGGGAIWIAGNPTGSQAELINCTLSNNTSITGGGGIANMEGGGGSSVTLTNCILWGNTDSGPTDESAQIFHDTSGTNVINYTCVQGWTGGFGGTGNIGDDPADDPLFVAPGSGDYRLTLGSPCIDVADPDDGVIPPDIFDLDNDTNDTEATPDLDLVNRELDGNDDDTPRVDMGSYEFIHPDICPWDLDGDCSVGATDLLGLLVTWGPCDDCDDCPADFDDNCSVGATDLLALLVNWGPCDPCSVEPPTLAEELADACLSQDDWDEFVDVMTDPESSEEDKDRYNCWMIHYMFHCNNCSCPHLPECPSPDPFN